LLLVLLADTALAQAKDPCINAYDAELARIQGELVANRKGGGQEEDRKLMRMVHLQIKLAADKAEACQKEAKRVASGAPLPAPPGIEKQCNDRAGPKITELNRSYSGRQLSESDMRAFRQSQERLQEEIRECIRRGASPR
jgi:hypothetical protein